MTPFADLQNFVVKHTDAKYFKADFKLYKKCFPQSRLIPELDRAPEFAQKGLDERMCTEILQHPDMCIDTVWENRGFALLNGKPVLMDKLKQTGLSNEQIQQIADDANDFFKSIPQAADKETLQDVNTIVTDLIAPLPDGPRGPIELKLKELIAAQMNVLAEVEKEEHLKIRRMDLLKTDLDAVKYNVLKGFVFDLNLDNQCENHKTETYLKVLKAYKTEMNATAKSANEPVPDNAAATDEAKKKEGHEPSTQE